MVDHRVVIGPKQIVRRCHLQCDNADVLDQVTTRSLELVSTDDDEMRKI